ncbi:MAG: 50S ribosomal protein L11 methyltransferase [Chloroflexia bacterium]|nr:50S ribosomal protein L11 methyltransferase [Chloroflexia bacterium]
MSESVNAATDAPDREWIELAVEVDAEAVEAVSELFARYGFNEGVVIDEPYVQDGDGDNLAVDPTRPFTLRTYVPAPDIEERALDEIRQALWHLGRLRSVGSLTTSTLKEEDWANAWKVHFPVHRIGRRVVVRPPWRAYEPAADDVVVELDPGMAFGTGLHPSTRLSMLGLETAMRAGATVLDVGTGSGILAIAAVKLGARHAHAVDIEPVAVRVAGENARRNGVSDQIILKEGSVGPGAPFPGRYDIVLANIIARILIELADGLATATMPDGRLVLAGIIDSREAEVAAAFHERGFAVVERRQEDDWISLVLRRASYTDSA